MKPSVIVPFRSLGGGKSRLSSRLDQPDRRRLCTAMLIRTLSLLSAYHHVLVVSDDEAVRDVLALMGAGMDFLLARRPGDLNQALSEARDHVPCDAGVLILPTDLILLDEGALEHFVGDPMCLSIGPDWACDGTNLLMLPAEQAREFQFQYGAGSFDKHVSEARRLGVQPRVVQLIRVAFDLDTPSDLDAMSATWWSPVGPGHPFTSLGLMTFNLKSE